MSEELDLQPDTDEVLQAEPEENYELSTIPVCVKDVEGPVRTQALPRKGGATFTRQVSNAAPLRVLTADHRRASAVIVSEVALLFALSQTSAQADQAMCWWPAATPLTLTCTTDVWVKVEGAAPANVSVFTERWAEGE